MKQMTLYSTLRSVLFLLLSGVMLGSCNTAKKGQVTERSLSADEIILQLSQNQIQANWLDARARLAYDDGELSVRGTAQIRLQRDSLVWMSVKKLGFEVARIQVTPDSVYVIDRINNTYGIFGLSYLEENFNLPADFQLLQTVILGNAWFPQRPQPDVTTMPEAFILSEKTPLRELSYRIHSSTFKLEEINVVDPPTNRSVKLGLSQYQPAGDNQLFAYFRTFKISSPETGSISMDMEFSDVTLNEPKRTQFEIPERYTRMD